MAREGEVRAGIIIEGDASKASSEFAALGATLAKLDGTMGRLASSATSAGDSTDDAGSAASGAGEGFDDAADKASGFDRNLINVGASIRTFESVVNLGQKALHLLARGFETTVEAALKFRSENDPLRREVEATGEASQRTAARIGDLFLPVIAGFGRAMAEAGGGIETFVTRNREVLSLEVAKWATDSAGAIVDTLLWSIEMVSIGLNKMSIHWMAAKQSFLLFIPGSAEKMGQLNDKIAETENDSRTLASTLEMLANKAHTFIGKVYTAAVEEAHKATDGLAHAADDLATQKDDEAKADADFWAAEQTMLEAEAKHADEAAQRELARQEIIARGHQAEAEYHEKRIAWAIQFDKMQQDDKARSLASIKAQREARAHMFDEWKSEIESVSSEISSRLTDTILEAASGAKTLGEAFSDMVDKMLAELPRLVLLWAIEAAVKTAVSSVLGLFTGGGGGGTGPALPASAPVPFERGGWVTGARSGMAFLHPGEVVLGADTVRALRDGGGAVAGGPMISLEVTFNSASLLPADKAAVKKVFREEILPMTARALGMVPR